MYYCANLACRAAERPTVSQSDASPIAAATSSPRGVCSRLRGGVMSHWQKLLVGKCAAASGSVLLTAVGGPEAAVARLRDVYSCAHGCNITRLTSDTVPTGPKVCPPA